MNLYIGIDWSSTKHDAAMINEHGAPVAALTFPHSPDGFAHFDEERAKTGASAADCAVGIETAYNVIIDFLWDRSYQHVYIVPPILVKSERHGQRPSGAHTDQSDAGLLADLVRTKRTLLQVWKPDSPLTRQIQASVSYRLFLTRQAVRLENRLSSVLGRYYPAALSVFSNLQAQIALHFVQAYPTPQAAASLSFEGFVSFAQKHGYRQPKRLTSCYARLMHPQPTASPETIGALVDEAAQLAGLLLSTVQAKVALERRLSALFSGHEDHAIFASLPGTGPFLGPALLAKFGDDRERFPSATLVQEVAGTCPVTAQSGKRRSVYFRRACDKDFRTIAQQWARCSVGESPWAMAYFQQHIGKGHTDSHAYRCLANRWLEIAWTLWQNKTTYDEAHHLGDCRQRSRPSVVS
jgi:transposase